MADKPNEKEGGEEAEPKSKKKLFLFIGIGVAVAAIAAGAAFMLMGGDDKPAEDETAQSEGAKKKDDKKDDDKDKGDSKEKEEANDKDEASEGEDKSSEGEEEAEAEETEDGEPPRPKINFGETFKLKPFNMNLGNPMENRFLRLEVSVEYKGGKKHLMELKAREPQIRDAIISVASRKTREFLLGPDGKDRLRLEMLNRINQYMDRKIESVLITGILIE